jgi:hypothetical protein
MNLLDNARAFYEKSPLRHIQDQRRKLYTKKLLLVIETAPFLSVSEKEQLSGLIPLYPTKTIKHVKDSLIRQGIIFLKLNPSQGENTRAWLNTVGETKK